MCCVFYTYWNFCLLTFEYWKSWNEFWAFWGVGLLFLWVLGAHSKLLNPRTYPSRLKVKSRKENPWKQYLENPHLKKHFDKNLRLQKVLRLQLVCNGISNFYPRPLLREDIKHTLVINLRKRKTKNDGKPPAKMKKLENLMMMMLERILGLIRKMIRNLLSKKSADGW